MTNTPMSEREKELVEAVQDFRAKANLKLLSGGGMTIDWNFDRMMKAIRAYDPKPEPVPVIPAWEEFIKGKPYNYYSRPDDGLDYYVGLGGGLKVEMRVYNAIREATSHTKAPTE